MDFGKLADKSLQGELLERDEMKAVLNASDEQIPELVSAAFKVRHHYFGKRVQIHMLPPPACDGRAALRRMINPPRRNTASWALLLSTTPAYAAT